MLPSDELLYMSTARSGENSVAPPVAPYRTSFTMLEVSVERIESCQE